MKIWSPIKQQVTKYCGKEDRLLLRSNFSSFPQYFLIYLQLQEFKCIFIFEMWLFNLFFLQFCKSDVGMDISNYFRLSLELQDNESRLYMTSSQRTYSIQVFEVWIGVNCVQITFYSNTKLFSRGKLIIPSDKMHFFFFSKK